MHQMRRADSGFALGCLGPGSLAPVVPTFPRTADLQRRLTALLSGVLGHGSAAQAGDPATSRGEVFIGVLHPVSLRL